MGSCCIKSKKQSSKGNNNKDLAPVYHNKKMTDAQRDERRQKALEAAENRQQENQMKGLSKKSYAETQIKKKKLEEAEKYSKNDKTLEWRV